MTTTYALAHKDTPYKIMKRFATYSEALEFATEAFDAGYENYVVLTVVDGKVVSITAEQHDGPTWV